MPAATPVYVGSSSRQDPTPPASDTPKDELARVNEAMYKQNVELAIRNKTLSVLRTLSAIATSALHVRDACEQIVDAIVRELRFPVVLMSLVNGKDQTLQNTAITKSEPILKALKILGKPIEETAVPLTQKDNLLVRAIADKERKITGNLFDILIPLVTQEIADEIKIVTTIQTIIIYPLYFGKSALGTLAIGLTKNAADLSRAEKETLDQLIDVVSITIDRTQLLEDIQNANEKLKELDKLKDEFISIASHDLRSPLSTAKNYLWMAAKVTEKQSKLDEYITGAQQVTDHAIVLVNDMLDVSRIEAGRIELTPQVFSISKLIQDIAKEMTLSATQNNIEISTTIEGDYSVNADPERIRQVLSNLVTNAIKFTPTGGTITLRATAHDTWIDTSVADTGIGIKKEDFPKLFTKFGRLDNSFTGVSKIPGTGLGLYICKKIIELSGGNIRAESVVGKGTTFTFSLPRV